MIPFFSFVSIALGNAVMLGVSALHSSEFPPTSGTATTVSEIITFNPSSPPQTSLPPKEPLQGEIEPLPWHRKIEPLPLGAENRSLLLLKEPLLPEEIEPPPDLKPQESIALSLRWSLLNETLIGDSMSFWIPSNGDSKKTEDLPNRSINQCKLGQEEANL